ncbi:MAG: hypothetical protein LBP28_02910 [Coriobacteriales bacterium]|nr:hypothetical protein [Coriobacteriales bacterium]
MKFSGIDDALKDLCRLGAELDRHAAASRAGLTVQSKGATLTQIRGIHRELQYSVAQMDKLVKQTIQVLINARNLFEAADASAALVFKDTATKQYVKRNFPGAVSTEVQKERAIRP